MLVGSCNSLIVALVRLSLQSMNFATATDTVASLDDLEKFNVFQASICCARCADLDSSNEIWPTGSCELLPSVPLEPCRIDYQETNLTSPASADYTVHSLGGLTNGQGHLLLQTPVMGPKLDVIHEDVGQLTQMHSFDFKACRLESEPDYAYEYVRKWLRSNRRADAGDLSKNYKILLGGYEICGRPRCDLTIVKRIIERFDE